MICIKCDKCGAEIKDCFKVRFLTKREKVLDNDSLSYSDEKITDEIHLCPVCVKKLFDEWMETEK